MKSLVVLITLFINVSIVLGQTVDSVATESSSSGNHLSGGQVSSYGGQNNQLAVKRNYSHTWTKKYGLWKLTTNTHD